MRHVPRHQTSGAHGGGGRGRRDGRDWPVTNKWGWPATIEWGDVRVETNCAANSEPANPEPIGPHLMGPHRHQSVLQWEAGDRQDVRESGCVGLRRRRGWANPRGEITCSSSSSSAVWRPPAGRVAAMSSRGGRDASSRGMRRSHVISWGKRQQHVVGARPDRVVKRIGSCAV